MAGFTDVIGFLASGGIFVSFMSGNSTRLALGIAQPSIAGLAAATLIALFVPGVILNVLVSGRASAPRRSAAPPPRRPAIATAGVALLLVAAAVLQMLSWTYGVVGTLCLAMGASNRCSIAMAI